MINVVIKKPSTGAWIYKIKLVSTLPTVDDIIQIQARVNKSRSIQFSLTNKYKKYAKFTAIFTNDSDNEFNVIPREGLLAPFGSEGTVFTI